MRSQHLQDSPSPVRRGGRGVGWSKVFPIAIALAPASLAFAQPGSTPAHSEPESSSNKPTVAALAPAADPSKLDGFELAAATSLGVGWLDQAPVMDMGAAVRLGWSHRVLRLGVIGEGGRVLVVSPLVDPADAEITYVGASGYAGIQSTGRSPTSGPRSLYLQAEAGRRFWVGESLPDLTRLGARAGVRLLRNKVTVNISGSVHHLRGSNIDTELSGYIAAGAVGLEF